LILDAIHSATSSFQRVNSIINQQPDAPIEQKATEISEYIKQLFAKKDIKKESTEALLAL
jgi:hypothetical protein